MDYITGWVAIQNGERVGFGWKYSMLKATFPETGTLYKEIVFDRKTIHNVFFELIQLRQELIKKEK